MFKEKNGLFILFCAALFICMLGFFSPASAACIDTDGDGYGSPGDASCPKGKKADCDNNDPKVYPGAAEICDGKDTNCDGWKPATDIDKDGDGVPMCKNDCNDNNNTVYPGAPELCDGTDNNCDYSIPVNERDLDADGYRTCGVPADCNDNDRYTNPGAQEWCSDTKDNNCNSQVDETPCICPDADNDGFTASYCGGTDCDDINNTIYPGAPELCTDGKDNDCNGLKDCADPNAVNCPAITDADGDGYDVAGICGTADCDDNDNKVYPGATEICDGKDSNCDGWKAPSDKDADGDGVPLCASDCDDANPNRFPGNLEHALRNTCDDFIDNDCDNLTDAADSDCTGSCQTGTSPKNGPHFFTLLNTDNTVHTDNNTLSCGKCHAADFQDPVRYACQRCHADPADTSNPMNGTLKAQYPLNPPYGYGSAPNVISHTTWTLGDQGCVTCHNPHTQEQDDLFGTTYGKYIKEYICYDSKGIQQFVEFTSNTGPGSFADGAPYNANICNTCHTTTNHQQNDGTAPGGQDHNNGQNCMQCHSHSGGFAPIGGTPAAPHNTTDFSNNCDYCHVSATDYSSPVPDSKCGQCHTPSGTLKASFPSAPDVLTHQSKVCVGCHQLMTGTGNLKLLKTNLSFVGGGTNVIFTSRTGTGSFADGPPYSENVCNACHTLTNHQQNDGTAPGGQDHNNGQDCAGCHPHSQAFTPILPDPVAPHNAQAFLNNCDYCHVNASDFTTKIPDSKCEQCHTPTGALKAGFPSAPDVLTHSVANGSGKYVYSKACVDCHEPMFGTTNLANVRTDLSAAGGGPSVNFTAYTGPGSFADGAPYTENICNTCHTVTNHQQADGTAPGGQDHNNSTDCASCHPHGSAFLPVGGDCTLCHNQTQPNGAGDYRRQVVGGDIGNASVKTSHHVNGTIDASTCEVCHDQSSHMGNVEPGVLLNDPDGGPSIAYTGTAGELTTLCLNCHDSNAANGNTTPFADSGDNATPPNVADEWALAYGHRAAGVACMDCHGDSDGTGGATDPFINAHGSATVSLLRVPYDAANQLGYCQNCHGDAGTANWGTNVTLEFNTANASRHPVGTPLASGKRLITGQLTGGWAPGAIMTCSDCHDTAGGANGPHGSSVKWMLTGTNKAWPYTSVSNNGSTSGTFFYLGGSRTNMFCANCHPDTGNSNVNEVHNKGDHRSSSRGACMNCHIRVPHGGKVSRLVSAANNTANLPARLWPNGNGGGTVYMRKYTRASSPGNYSASNCYSSNSSCGDHNSSSNGTESW